MKQKAKRSKKYRITMRVDASYFVEVEVSAPHMIEAGRKAMNTAREEAMRSLPDAADLNSVEVIIEDGEKVEDNT